MSFIELNLDLKAEIFDYLTHKELLTIEPTCRSFMEGVEKCFEWRCRRELLNTENIKKLSWKKLYEATAPLLVFQKACLQGKLNCTEHVEVSYDISADRCGYSDAQAIDGKIFVLVKPMLKSLDKFSHSLTTLNFEKKDLESHQDLCGSFIDDNRFLKCEDSNNLTLLDLKTGASLLNIETDFDVSRIYLFFSTIHCDGKNLFIKGNILNEINCINMESHQTIKLSSARTIVCSSSPPVNISLKNEKINYRECNSLILLDVLDVDGSANRYMKYIDICDLQNGILEYYSDEGASMSCPKLIGHHKLGYCLSSREKCFLKVIDLETKKIIMNTIVGKGAADVTTFFTLVGDLILSGSQGGKINLWTENCETPLHTLEMGLTYNRFHAIEKLSFYDNMIIAQSHFTVKIWKTERQKEELVDC